MGCVHYVRRLQPDKSWELHRGPGLYLKLSQENDQACLTLVVLIPRAMGWRAVVAEDHGCRTLFSLQRHSLDLVPTAHDDSLRAGKQSHPTAYLFLSLSQYTGCQRFIFVFGPATDTRKLDYLTGSFCSRWPNAV
jgi:hypothetical protein